MPAHCWNHSEPSNAHSAHGTRSPRLSRRTLLLSIGLLLLLFAVNAFYLNTPAASSILYAEWLPSVSGRSEQRIGGHAWRKSKAPDAAAWRARDKHPIRRLMLEAEERFAVYEEKRSMTFQATVERYRKIHGRHPPPGFKEVICTFLLWSCAPSDAVSVVQIRPGAEHP